MSERPDPEFREQPNPETNERTRTDYREQPNPEYIKHKIVLPNKRRDPVFYIALTLAAVCIIGVICATAFVAGFITARKLPMGDYSNADMLKKQMAMNQKGYDQGQRGQIVAKIVILKGNNGLNFSQPVAKMPAGNGIALINQTDQVQVVLVGDSKQRLEIAPGQVNTLFIKEGGRSYIIHLESDPNATFTIYVGN